MLITKTVTKTKGKPTQTTVDVSNMELTEFQKIIKAVESAAVNDKTFDEVMAKLRFVAIEKEVINL